jgi:hypothetical protein
MPNGTTKGTSFFRVIPGRGLKSIVTRSVAPNGIRVWCVCCMRRVETHGYNIGCA